MIDLFEGIATSAVMPDVDIVYYIEMIDLFEGIATLTLENGFVKETGIEMIDLFEGIATHCGINKSLCLSY